MATGELRERVRERLVSAEQGLARALAGGAAGPRRGRAAAGEGRDDEVELRRRRLARALADFDAATIATTHGFCQEVLGGLGVAGDVEPDATFVEDVGDLRRGGRRRPLRAPLPRRRAARTSTARRRCGSRRVAIDNPAAPIEPREAPAGHASRRCACGWPSAVRDELDARKRRLAVMTYDDLLTRLDETLAGPGGDVAVARLRERYRVVLVDEFQDTDPVQWEIVRRAFGDGGAHARADRRPQAGDLRVPRRRRLRLPARRRARPGTQRDAARSTGAATRG